ncbi:MAG TPA: XF1762 family protein, partial [Conexibacter sp.]|nr:XF1762 family protein [Conexibacter sp.]
MKFALGAARGDELVGVAIVGRPLARLLQDGWTLEVLRLCTTGDRNACSFLYGACWRAARALGYRRLVTYTRADEGGASLRASGFRVVGEVKSESWDRPSRPRDGGDPQQRLRWELSAEVRA